MEAVQAPVLSVDEVIERHVKALQCGDADGKQAYYIAYYIARDPMMLRAARPSRKPTISLIWAAEDALKKLANEDDANRAAIARRLVGLLLGGSANDQKRAATALTNLSYLNAANKVAITAAGAIAPLVALVTNGTADGQELAVAALGNLAHDDANKAAIDAAGGVEALMALLANGPDWCKEGAKHVLAKLGPLVAKRFSRLQSENASLKRQLAGDDVVDLRDGDASPPAKKRNALRDAHDEQQSSTLNRVKEEKTDAEGARDRNDVVAAAASAAAATATAEAADAAEDLRDSQELTDQLVLSENNKMSTIDELRGTVSERDARIEALEAEAREKDATIAELRGRVGQLERPAPRGGGRATRSRT